MTANSGRKNDASSIAGPRAQRVGRDDQHARKHARATSAGQNQQ
jgi:hypothetical protein